MWKFVTVTVILGALTLPLAAQTAEAEDESFDLKTYTCADHIRLVNAEDGRAEIVLLWAHGYWSALHGVDEHSGTITEAMIEEFRARLSERCEQHPERLFIVTVKTLPREEK